METCALASPIHQGHFGAMTTPWLPLLPHGLPWVALGTCLLLLAGWLLSILIARHQQRKWFWLFFPLTHPLALLNDLVRWRRKAWLPPACYILAWILWSWGGFRAHQHEFERMHRILARLKYEAQPIRATDLARVSVNPERNRWDHPYLRPLAEAANPGEDGPKTQEAIDRSYAAYQRPRSQAERNEEAYEGSERSFSTYQPFSKYALLAADLKLAKEESEALKTEALPQNLDHCISLVQPWIDGIEQGMPSLQEALERPENHYPYAWEEGFAMLLPQLSTLRNMATAQSLKTTHHALLGEAEAAYQSTLLGMKLCATQSMDLIISRLVQAAMLHVTLEGIHAAQQQHLWDANAWEAIDRKLEPFDFLGNAAACIRTERAFGQTSIEPILNSVFSKGAQTFAELTGPLPAPPDQAWARVITDGIFTQYVQAFFCKQWRLCLEAYESMIKDLEVATANASSLPWMKCRVDWKEEAYRDKGVFANLLLPALNLFYDNLLKTQTQIRLMRICTLLERHYLEHGAYPSDLMAIITYDLTNPMLDPMTHEPLHYQVLGEGAGFELYSVGLNGKDDQGMRQKKQTKQESDAGDDMLIRLSPEEPLLPPMSILP